MSEADRTKWDAKWAGRSVAAPDPFVEAIAERLPVAGRALDVAGGGGRHALWLAARGLDVHLCDVSPVAVALAQREAEARGLALTAFSHDLEGGLPGGPWDLIFSFHYLQRDLFPAFLRELAPGGLLAFVQPTVRNLDRHAHPSAHFCLGENELERLLTGFEVLRLDEGWRRDRHEARALAQKPATSP